MSEKFLNAVLHQHETREQLLKRVREIIDTYSPLCAVLQATVEEVRQFLDFDQVVISCIYPNGDIVATDSRIAATSINNDQHCPCGKPDLITPILGSCSYLSPLTDNPNSETNLWGMLIAHNCADNYEAYHLGKWDEWSLLANELLNHFGIETKVIFHLLTSNVVITTSYCAKL